jgi:phenylalanyl-tRNA synthetase beta chain
MKISYNWIKDYLDIDLDPHKVADILTNIGLEIEGTEEWSSVSGSLEGIVIGEVLASRKHPDADRLTVNTVNIGDGKILTIVCGAPNVAEGQKVPVALAGSCVMSGEEKIEIKNSRIRGQLSEGMICAEDEIGMGTSHEGIMVLNPDAVPGTPAKDYFKVEKDFIFEIGLTPNRIDSGSHFGTARDLAAYLAINQGLETRPVLPSVADFKPDGTKETFEITVENLKDCPRYTGLNIFDVTVGESPEWLKNRLRAVGLNPINNVVDITNFVQYEIGQPLHAFDADKVEGGQVIIKNLPEKSGFVTLDEIRRELSSKDLMICNKKEGMCIAGVFGGSESGVTSGTKNIFLESAYFNPVSIRKTARRHGLQTDASFRFERGADPNITLWALKRTALLIRDIAGGKLSADYKDVYPEKIKNCEIEVRYGNIERLIGKKISIPVIKKICGLLDMKIKLERDTGLLLDIPAYRVDVQREADVIEEILRIYGYNNIEIDDHVNSTLSYLVKPDKDKLVNTISDILTASGFSEIMCNSLVPASWFENNADFNSKQLVRLANPLSSDLNVLRQSLLYGGLSSIAWNINRQNYDLKLYEFGNCYFFTGRTHSTRSVDSYSEKIDLDIFISGNRGTHSWNQPPVATDFFYLKSFVEMVMKRLGIDPDHLVINDTSRKYYSESISYLNNDQMVAEMGIISKNILKQFDIEQEVYYGHVEWDTLVKLISINSIRYRELPKYPSVRRDLALLVDNNIKFNRIRDLAFRTEKNLLKKVGLFDVYESETLGQNKKSYAVSFILQDESKTLTDKYIDKVMNNFIRVFERELDAQIR